MSYLRVKWVKGHPYLYEQASYREGNKVRTKHIRYVGKYGYAGSGGGGSGGAGLAPPEGLSPERKAYVDQEISRLKLADKFPFEREILRQYVYHQDYQLRFNSRRLYARGYVSFVRYLNTQEVREFGLRSDSSAFTWLHETGHSLEYADKIVDSEIEALRWEFGKQMYEDYKAATAQGIVSSIPMLESFIQKYGRLFDIREIDIPETESGQQRVLKELSRLKSTFETEGYFGRNLDVVGFEKTFAIWTDIQYRRRPSEIFADTVASLILDPKKAFDAHGPEGRKYVTRVWIKLVKHFEDKYQLSLQRPKKSKQQTAS